MGCSGVWASLRGPAGDVSEAYGDVEDNGEGYKEENGLANRALARLMTEEGLAGLTNTLPEVDKGWRVEIRWGFDG